MTLAVDLQVQRGSLDLDAGFTVADGEVLAVLGPNGAGKTSLLRALAGLDAIDGGSILIDGVPVDDPEAELFVAPERRPVALVFQDYLLFPHLSALDNVAFAPRARGMAKPAARATARPWLDRLGLAEFATAKPAALSGGQAQRVALARALAAEPSLLLLDEPLAALDATTRPSVRRDLRRYLTEFTGSAILVTHDPLDALALADRVLILEAGHVSQQGSIAEVTSRPRSPYVADLIGLNLLLGAGRGTAVGLDEGSGSGSGTVTVASPVDGPVFLLIPPHAVGLHRSRPDSSARNQWACRIEGLDLLGDRVRVRLGGEVPLVAEVTPGAVADLGLAEGLDVWASVKATEIVAYPR